MISVMIINAAFKNISVISWMSVLFVEETVVSEKTTDLPQVTDKLHHRMLNRVHITISGSRTRIKTHLKLFTNRLLYDQFF